MRCFVIDKFTYLLMQQNNKEYYVKLNVVKHQNFLVFGKKTVCALRISAKVKSNTMQLKGGNFKDVRFIGSAFII